LSARWVAAFTVTTAIAAIAIGGSGRSPAAPLLSDLPIDTNVGYSRMLLFARLIQERVRGWSREVGRTFLEIDC